MWDETKDPAKSQGWCPMVVDTNGDGAIGEYTQPNQPLDPKKDMRVSGFPYGIIVNPIDQSVWWGDGGRARPDRAHRARQQSANDLPVRGL